MAPSEKPRVSAAPGLPSLTRVEPDNLQAEFLGDYVYADTTNTYGIGVWNDVRDGQVCDAINVWRTDLRTEEDAGDPPNPLDACPPRFGETDIWSYTTG